MLAVALALLVGTQDDAEVTAAIDKFKSAMKTTSPTQQSAAVLDLGKTPHAKTLALLVPLLQADPLIVRVAAAKCLGKFSEQKKAALQALLHALAVSAEAQFTRALMESLGVLGDASVMPTVQKFFFDKDGIVVKQAVGLAGAMPAVTSIDPLLDLMRRQEKTVKANSAGGSVLAGGTVNGNNQVVAKSDENARKTAEDLITEINKSLVKITGENLAGSQPWQTWWNQAKATFKISK